MTSNPTITLFEQLLINSPSGGEKEVATESVSVRRQGEGDKGVMKISSFAGFLKSEIEEQLSIV